MKFGKYLEANVKPGWESMYLEYAKLKAMVKVLKSAEEGMPEVKGASHTYITSLTVVGSPQVAGKLGSKDVTQEDFFKALDRDVQKIGSFAAQHVRKSQKLLDKLEKDVDIAVGSGQQGAALRSLEMKAKEVGDSFLDLEKYVNLNYTGFYKILKKHDKCLPSTPCRQFYMARLHQTPWIQGDYSAVFVALSRIHSKLRHDSMPEAQDLTLKDFVRYTRKYWVRTEHVSEVKHFILQHLPVFQLRQDLLSGDSQMTNSVYFDNSQLELYHGRLEKRPNAIALRIRWYGTGQAELAFIERKTHRESWTGEASVKERFTLDPDLVMPFLKGEYNVEQAVEDLKAKGKSEAELSKFRKLFSEIQTLVDVKQLRPNIRTQYMRVAFQIPFDSTVRVSLDTNLTMIKENSDHRPTTCFEEGRWCRDPSLPIPRTENTRFPHAILEVKLSLKEGTDAPLWVTQLIDSGWLTEIHKFSKFIHGAAVLLPDQVQAVPYWIDDESVRASILASSALPDTQSTYHALSKRRHNYSDTTERPGPIETSESLTHPLLDVNAKTDFLGVAHGEQRRTGFLRSLLGRNHPARSQLPRKVPMRLEPKTSFANERTFLRWIHMAIILGGISSAMLGSSSADNHDAQVIGMVTIPVAIAIILYASWLYYWRARQIKRREAKYAIDFDDRVGPICLSIILICVYSSIFAYMLTTM